MKKYTVSRIWEGASYVLILGGTVYYFVSGKETGITMIIVALAIFCYAMTYRVRYRICQDENEELRSDIRRLTNLLEVAKKTKNDK
ncbi:MAG: hypothetical protein K5864_07825 [Bacteroidales bacterium]|nr:hypothetical protein [Bacteroidales bacterium]